MGRNTVTATINVAEKNWKTFACSLNVGRLDKNNSDVQVKSWWKLIIAGSSDSNYIVLYKMISYRTFRIIIRVSSSNIEKLPTPSGHFCRMLTLYQIYFRLMACDVFLQSRSFSSLFHAKYQRARSQKMNSCPPTLHKLILVFGGKFTSNCWQSIMLLTTHSTKHGCFWSG